MAEGKSVDPNINEIADLADRSFNLKMEGCVDHKNIMLDAEILAAKSPKENLIYIKQ